MPTTIHTPASDVLLSVSGQTGAVVGSWYQLNDFRRTHFPISVTLSAGTATITIEGRNGPNDAPVTLASFSGTDQVLVQASSQVRVNVTAAAGATIQVTTDKALVFVG